MGLPKGDILARLSRFWTHDSTFTAGQLCRGQSSIMTVGHHDAPLPFNLTELDRQILAQTDEQFKAHTWNELKQIIGKLPRRNARRQG